MDTTDVELLRAGLARQIADADAWPTWRDKQKREVFRELVSDKFTDEQIAHSYFKLPTGYGKTVMFARMARAYFDALTVTGTKKHQKIVIIVPRLSLIEQTQKNLEKFANITATEFSGKKKDNSSDVIITTYNSLVKLFGIVDFNDVALIFADEAHHMLGEKISERLTFYNQFVPIIGFTATPKYEANRAVANMLNTEIFAMDIPKAVKNGVLSPVKNILYRSSIVCDLSNIPATSTGDYDYEKITTKISPETLATEIARVYADGFDKETGTRFNTLKAIINCPNAATANLQAAKINEIMGLDVAISLHKVGISDKEYDRLKGEFESGRYTVACQVGTLTEGFDDVTVSMCINYPTRSRVKAEQTAGRAIRLDEDNPDKIAFVLDTIFRATKNEAPEEILYTASNSHQVLFKDIAEGNIVLYPKDFQRDKTNIGTRTHGNIEFVDFDLITDSATLIELNRKTEERIADEFIPEKTDEWLSAIDLVKDKDFPRGSYQNITDALIKFQNDPEFKGFIRDMKTGAHIAKCIHISKKQRFAEKAGFRYYPPKTDEWLSAKELAKDDNFPSGYPTKINTALVELEHDPECEGFIQDMKTGGGMVCKCIHISKKQRFAEKAGFKYYPPKTDEWLSANDLAKDEGFPSNTLRMINNALDRFEQDPEFKGFIQDMKTSGKLCKCIHVSKKQRFAERAGFKTYPIKTPEWLAAIDLTRDQDFPSGYPTKINTALVELEHDPEFEGFILDMRSGSQVVKCLHVSKKQLFAEKAGFKVCSRKTAEWLSAVDLAKDKDFPRNSPNIINAALNELEYNPEFKGFILDMRSGSQVVKCLHVSKKQLFAERAGFRTCPIKTDEWLSANELAKDEFFPSNTLVNINTALTELEHDPEFEGFIRFMNIRGRTIMCIHKSKKQRFAEKAGFTQKRQLTQQSLQDGTKVVGVMGVVQDIENSTRPDDPHVM